MRAALGAFLFAGAVACQAPAASAAGFAPGEDLAGDPAAWIVADKQGQGVAHFVDHLGRKSLHARRGVVFLKDVDLANGVLEADLSAARPGIGFMGLAFRVRSDQDYELIYLRNGHSGQADAVQYDPVQNGSITWQLHPDAQAAAELPQDRWIHVKVVFAGARAELYVDGDPKPALVVDDLAQGDTHGSVGFWSLAGGGYASNVRYAPGPPTPYSQPVRSFAKGALRDWSISPAFDVSQVSPAHYPQPGHFEWQRVQADAPGILVLNRFRVSPDAPIQDRAAMAGDGAGAKVVFAKTIIHADRAGLRRLAIAYSDEAVLYLNGIPLFRGKNAFLYREPGAAGRLYLNDEVYLPLRKGDNELMAAVSEYNGGWAIECVLDPAP